jgi:hypothetical protein
MAKDVKLGSTRPDTRRPRVYRAHSARPVAVLQSPLTNSNRRTADGPSVRPSASRTRWLSDDQRDLIDGLDDERVADFGPLAAARFPALASKLHPALWQTGRHSRDLQTGHRLTANRGRHPFAVPNQEQLFHELPEQSATNQKLAPWCRHDKDGKQNAANDDQHLSRSLATRKVKFGARAAQRSWTRASATTIAPKTNSVTVATVRWFAVSQVSAVASQTLARCPATR